MTWTIPNVLTTLRLLAAPGLALMFLYFNRPWADWLALALFLGASLTDWFDGFLARLWGQETRFGAMLDPIADKITVVIALLVITGYSGMNPWLILPTTAIIFREIFVSGLREFLGDDAKRLKVTDLAKWKTTVQMAAIAVLFLGTGMEQLHLGQSESMPPFEYLSALTSPDWNSVNFSIEVSWYGWFAGIGLIWAAAALTLVTGFGYFRKAGPFLREHA